MRWIKIGLWVAFLGLQAYLHFLATPNPFNVVWALTSALVFTVLMVCMESDPKQPG